MIMKKMQANKHAYNADIKRSHDAVKFIIIHYTGIDNDMAQAEGNFFAKTNTRSAGAHFFVDRKGNIVKSVDLNRVAWSVGGKKYANKGGKLYGIANNSNSVSIEMCDCKSNVYPSEAQIEAMVSVIKYIRKHCKNANLLIRHYDVNGKPCPGTMTDETEEGRERWIKLKARLYHDAGLDRK